MTTADHLRIALTGGILLATFAEIAWQLWANRDRIRAALNQEEQSW